MKSLVIFLIVLTLKPPSVVSELKDAEKFDKYVDFLVDHISGEVMICDESGGDQVANNIIEKISRLERPGLITILDANVKHSQMECPRCNWFVTLHKADKKKNIIPIFVLKNIMTLSWSTSSNFIIIFTNPATLNEKHIFQQLSISTTLKLIILFEDATNKQIRMIAPDIFLKKKMIDLRIGDDLAKVFMQKIENLHGYPLRTAYVEKPGRLYEENGEFCGVDGEYMSTILTALNASYKVTRKIPQESEDQLEGNFITGGVDINFNPNFHTQFANTKAIKSLYPQDILEIRILVPKSGFVSTLQLFLQPFSIKVWITVIVVFMVCGWGWHHLNRRYSRRQLTRTEIGFQLTRMQITQGFNLSSIIVPLRFKRVFVIGFIFWSFVLSQAYQSVMIANLLEPFSYPEINTIEQLNMSGLNVVTPHIYRNWIKTISLIASNLKVNNTKHVLALKHEFESNTAYVMSNIDAYQVLYSEKNIKDGRPIMHLMKEVVAYAPQNYFISKKLPLQEEMNEIIGRIRASGIDQYWKTLHFGRAEIRYKRKLAQAAEPVLHMEQFQYAFYVLFIGQSLAFAVFIFELIWARLQRYLNAYFRTINTH